MRFEMIMAFAVRDEGDILQLKLEHHLGVGFTHFFVIDHGSIDETSDVLAHYERQGLVSVIRMNREARADNSWIELLITAARERNADAYLAICDTDEFIFYSGELRELLDGSSAYELPRINFFPDTESIQWERKGLFEVFRNGIIEGVDTSDIESRLFEDEPTEVIFNDISFPLFFMKLDSTPKVFFPLSKVDELYCGAHSVKKWRDANSGTVETLQQLQIRHYPLRSVEQLRTRVQNYRNFFAMNPELHRAWGWQNRFLLHVADKSSPHQCGLESLWSDHILPSDLGILKDSEFVVRRSTHN